MTGAAPSSGRGRRFAIAVSRFNEPITERLAMGARACLLEYGVRAEDITVVHVPGAWELPLAAQWLARQRPAGVIALGCIIRGDTPHFEYVAGAAAEGLARVSLDAGIPVAFGVLTTEDTEQALARAGGKEGNKGWEAALAVLEMMALSDRLEGHEPGPQQGT
ncbi:MAG TPA: 6,7-dimethyl-8-ribityllumazine synthase [Longimicrobiales bacterium]|nr:6,7-dimethyl-8-ribityllumazine synthase [Longimicrobiales bacterium]